MGVLEHFIVFHKKIVDRYKMKSQNFGFMEKEHFKISSIFELRNCENAFDTL